MGKWVFKMDYKRIDTGLDLGTKFLTAETAYFLGLLLADERESITGTIYWSAPIRHNPKQVSLKDLESHYSLVRNIASVIHKSDFTHLTDFLRTQNVALRKFNAGKTGIVTLFKEIVPNYTIEDLIYDIKGPLLASNKEVQHAFIVGAFDGRGSDDGSSLIALDFEKNVVLDIIVQCLLELGITPNINSGVHARLREDPNAEPRRDQIRINRNVYLSEIGFISIGRFNKSLTNLRKRNIYANRYQPYEIDYPLPGLKLIRDIV